MQILPIVLTLRPMLEKDDTAINRTFGLSLWVVIELTQFLEKKVYVIFTDNFYTSPQLVDYLFFRDTYLCGTVRTKRKRFPKPLVKSQAEQRRLQRGDFDWLMCGPLITSFWKDNIFIYYLSTFHAPEDGQLRTNRKRRDTKRFNRHTDSKAYAQYMGGVDRLDQMTRLNKEKKT